MLEHIPQIPPPKKQQDISLIPCTSVTPTNSVVIKIHKPVHSSHTSEIPETGTHMMHIEHQLDL